MARPKKATVNENEIKMTQSSYDELVAELDNLQNVVRKEIADEIAAARDLGDLSENHAYTVAMERKDLNENRISEIEDILKKAKVIEINSTDSFVSVGETVEISNLESNKAITLTLVGSEETKSANPLEGKISTDSPIGKAIFNARVGDVVDVVLPAKTVKYKIVKFVKSKKAAA